MEIFCSAQNEMEKPSLLKLSKCELLNNHQEKVHGIFLAHDIAILPVGIQPKETNEILLYTTTSNSTILKTILISNMITSY